MIEFAKCLLYGCGLLGVTGVVVMILLGVMADDDDEPVFRWWIKFSRVLFVIFVVWFVGFVFPGVWR